MREAGWRLGYYRVMNGRRRVFVILGVTMVVALGMGFGVWKWVTREKPSYESAFVEYVWIDYPAGSMLEGSDFGGDRMDSILRERKAGYLAGVTSRGDPPEVVEVELAVDLDARATRELVEEFKGMGLVPKEATFESGTYPRSGLLDYESLPKAPPGGMADGRAGFLAEVAVFPSFQSRGDDVWTSGDDTIEWGQ